MRSMRELWLVTAAVIVATLLFLWHPWTSPSKPVPRQIVKTQDSLDATKPAFDSSNVASAVARAAYDSALRVSAAEQKRLQSREESLRELADEQQHRADSLEQLSNWKAAYQARNSEAIALRVELDTAHARIDSLRADKARLVADTVKLHEDFARSEARRTAVEKQNVVIATALARATECTIVFRIRCPSRIETAVGVVAVEAIIGIAAKAATSKPLRSATFPSPAVVGSAR